MEHGAWPTSNKPGLHTSDEYIWRLEFQFLDSSPTGFSLRLLAGRSGECVDIPLGLRPSSPHRVQTQPAATDVCPRALTNGPGERRRRSGVHRCPEEPPRALTSPAVLLTPEPALWEHPQEEWPRQMLCDLEPTSMPTVSGVGDVSTLLQGRGQQSHGMEVNGPRFRLLH